MVKRSFSDRPASATGQPEPEKLSSASLFEVQFSIAKLRAPPACKLRARKSSRSENFHRAKSSFLFDRANLLITSFACTGLSVCIYTRARPFNLSSAMVDLKRDFKIFIALNVLSGMHEATGIVTGILKRSLTFGNRESSSFERSCSLHVFFRRTPPDNKSFQFQEKNIFTHASKCW